jgi:hypothetical protein
MVSEREMGIRAEPVKVGRGFNIIPTLWSRLARVKCESSQRLLDQARGFPIDEVSPVGV